MYCIKCGNEINDGERFCSKCGLEIDTSNNETVENHSNEKNDSAPDTENEKYAEGFGDGDELKIRKSIIRNSILKQKSQYLLEIIKSIYHKFTAIVYTVIGIILLLGGFGFIKGCASDPVDIAKSFCLVDNYTGDKTVAFGDVADYYNADYDVVKLDNGSCLVNVYLYDIPNLYYGSGDITNNAYVQFHINADQDEVKPLIVQTTSNDDGSTTGYNDVANEDGEQERLYIISKIYDAYSAE